MSCCFAVDIWMYTINNVSFCQSSPVNLTVYLLINRFFIIISCTALYQASISSFCDRPSGNLSVCPKSVLWQTGWVDPDAIGMVSWVSRCMGVLDGIMIVEGKGSYWMNLGHPIVTNGDFATQLFPNKKPSRDGWRYVVCDLELWPIKNSFCAFLAMVKTYSHTQCRREVKKSPEQVKVWATQTVPYKFNHAKVKKDLKNLHMFSWAPLLVMGPVQCTACTPLSMALLTPKVKHVHLLVLIWEQL